MKINAVGVLGNNRTIIPFKNKLNADFVQNPNDFKASDPISQESMWSMLLALSGIHPSTLTSENRIKLLNTLTSTNELFNNVQSLDRIQTNTLIRKYLKQYRDIPLLYENNMLNRNGAKYDRAIEHIRNTGFEKLTSNEPIKPLNPNPSIWSVTSEFAPIKEGGLGSVPPEIRNNIIKKGIDMPTFVPMYLGSGSSLTKNGDKYTYRYKNSSFENLEKAVTFKMDVYRSGEVKTIPVEIYLDKHLDEEGNTRKLFFIKTDGYFDGSIYEENAKTEEQEKFAVMSKAVYELAKAKIEGLRAFKECEINNQDAYDELSSPDAMMLNDWHASPIAALMRYKAGMENAHGQISDDTKEKLENMTINTIGHNAMYQGDTKAHNDDRQRIASTSNVLNTLFDKYAYDIVSNAQSGSAKLDPDNPKAQNLDNVLLVRDAKTGKYSTNFLNMGIILSDFFHPVSKNYADELIRPQNAHLSKQLQWVIERKTKAGKVQGVINGNDYNNISLPAKEKNIKQFTGLDFEIYDKNSPLDEVLEKRRENKINLYKNFIMPFTQSEGVSEDKIESLKPYISRLEFVEGEQGTNIPLLSDEEILETPIFMSGGRLVDQKGIDVLCGAVKMLFDNWDKDFKGKPKPIFYIAGGDGENGKQRAIIENLKNNELQKEDNDRVIFGHGFTSLSGFMAASDYFLMPSKFEPCGLTQSETFAVGTPPIASYVGGLVDTVNRDGRENGILTTPDKPLSAEEFYQAIKKGLKIFYDDKERYQGMVKDSYTEDLSWSLEGGPIYEYMKYFGS